MMIFKFKLVFSLLLASMFASSKLFSQNKLDKKNLIEVYIPFYNFFDGNAVKKELYKFKLYQGGLAVGVAYQHQLGFDKLAFTGSLEFINFYYPTEQLRPPGAIFERTVILVNVGICYQFSKNRITDFFLLSSISYRHGDELMVLGYPRWFEVRVKNHVLRDIGVNIGFRASKDLSKRILFSTELLGSYYVLRKDTGGFASFDKGSTKGLLTLNFKLGYRF
jgi:hypothetical protein